MVEYPTCTARRSIPLDRYPCGAPFTIRFAVGERSVRTHFDHRYAKETAMLKKIGFLPGLFACILASGCMPNALAGDSKLVSAPLHTSSLLEITCAPNPPAAAPLEHDS